MNKPSRISGRPSDGLRSSAIEMASTRLRQMAIAADDGAALGSEDALQSALGTARSTVRQAARILEREGLIRVRRGPNGGYFAARPDARVIEQAVSAYLQARSIEYDDALVVAGLLWPEAVRRAAASAPSAASVERIERLVDRASDDMTHPAFTALEKQVSHLVMTLAASDYIELILDINLAFYRLQSRVAPTISAEFIEGWKTARRLELTAIRTADQELAVFAARRFRVFFHDWVQMRGQGRDRTR